MNIYVANFHNSTTETNLKHIFRKYGRVASVTIWVDFKTGERKGFGFVKMVDHIDASVAISELNGRFWRGKQLTVRTARTQDY
jgi:polyadenylate-binding protein